MIFDDLAVEDFGSRQKHSRRRRRSYAPEDDSSNGDFLFVLVSLAMAASSDKAEVKGLIISRTGDTLIVKSGGRNVTVVLTEDTRTKDNTGLFGVGKDEKADTVLIPGLKLDVDGVSDDHGRVVAQTITVDGDDLETAEMIQAGLHPTAQQVAANMKALEANSQDIQSNAQEIAEIKKFIAMYQRNAAVNKVQTQQSIRACEQSTKSFMALSEYDVKSHATVNFPVGSSTLSPQDEQQLKQLAESAVPLTGYLIEVVGYADASGEAKMNEQLSEDRAKAVVAYLTQQAGVPVHRLVAPGAMGEYRPAASR